MSEPRWLCVCEPETSTLVTSSDFSAQLEPAPSSPIDDYYSYVEHLLTLGSKQALDESQTLGRLLLLGLVSGVEAYFRSVIAGLLRLCPLCRKTAADQLIPFGSIDYYGVDSVELGLFDATSLAGAAEVRKRTQGLLGITLSPGSSVYAALDEFDKICHLRHAAVHARGTLNRGNAAALALPEESGRRALHVTFVALQRAGVACHSTVRSYNRAVYRRTVERWIGEGIISGQWTDDREAFKPLFALFSSRKDATAPANAYQAYRSLASSL